MSARSSSTEKVAPTRPPVLALDVSEACAALGVSWDCWRQHVEPGVRVVRVGRRKLVAVAELERWLVEHGEPMTPTDRLTSRGSR